jgi:hypothetical protein
MMGYSSLSSIDYRMHLVADYDNFAFAFDQSADATYGLTFFGQYVPSTGLTPYIPYFAFHNTSIAPTAGTALGSVAGNDGGGGISFPDIYASGTVSLGVDRLAQWIQVSTQPNKMYNIQRFDEFPMFVGGFETPNQMGIVGQHSSFLREVFNMSNHDTNATGTRMVIGSSLTLATVKTSIPWHSGTTPGTGATRTGIQFGM